MLIYVAGPYSSDPVLGTRDAVQAGLAIYERWNVGVVIPHTSLLSHAMFPRPVEFWYAFDLKQVEHCHALFRLPGESSGADAEEAYAETLGIPIFTDMDELGKFITR